MALDYGRTNNTGAMLRITKKWIWMPGDAVFNVNRIQRMCGK
jgi:hypothetical protein